MSFVADYLRFAIWAVLVTIACVAIELAVTAARGFAARRALARRLVPAPMIALRFGGPHSRPPKICGECDIEHRCAEHRR